MGERHSDLQATTATCHRGCPECIRTAIVAHRATTACSHCCRLCATHQANGMAGERPSSRPPGGLPLPGCSRVCIGRSVVLGTPAMRGARGPWASRRPERSRRLGRRLHSCMPPGRPHPTLSSSPGAIVHIPAARPWPGEPGGAAAAAARGGEVACVGVGGMGRPLGSSLLCRLGAYPHP